MRVIATSASLALLLGIAACGDDPASDPPPPPPPPIDTDEEEEEEDEGPYPFGSMTYYADFGFDADAGTTVPYTFDGQSFESALQILVLSTSYFDVDDNARPDHICSVFLGIDDLEATATSDSHWAMFELAPSATNLLQSNCGGVIDTTDYFGADVDQVFSEGFGFQLAVGGPIHEDIVSQFEEEEFDHNWGATVSLVGGADPIPFPEMYSYAFEMDEERVVHNNPVPTSTANAPDGIATANYIIDFMYVYTFVE